MNEEQTFAAPSLVVVAELVSIHVHLYLKFLDMLENYSCKYYCMYSTYREALTALPKKEEAS